MRGIVTFAAQQIWFASRIMSTPNGKGKRSLPADVDFTAGSTRTKVDYSDGIRNHVTASKNIKLWGYKVFVKWLAPTEKDAYDMVDTIRSQLDVKAECGYWPAKTASEAKDGKPKEAALARAP